MSPYDLLDRTAEQTIAQQLTLLDFQYFKSIEVSLELWIETIWIFFKPIELLDLAWNKDEKKYRAPNVLRLIENANKTTLWVASTILSRTDVADRAKAISKWIAVAEVSLPTYYLPCLTTRPALENTEQLCRFDGSCWWFDDDGRR